MTKLCKTNYNIYISLHFYSNWVNFNQIKDLMTRMC